MVIWIICWVNNRGVPDMDIFTDTEQAQKCLAFVIKSYNNAIMRKIEIRKEEPEQTEADTELVPLPEEQEEVQCQPDM